MHSVRLLLDQLPELLVEQRQVPGPRNPAPGLSLARRQPRRIYRRTARRARRPVPPLSLPHDHELRQRLSQGTEPGARDCRGQEARGRAAGVNDSIEEPKRGEHFSAVALDDGWVSWNLRDPTRFNAYLEPLSVRAEPPTSDGRPRARVRMLPERRHSNLGDNVHGAVSLGLVDVALF